MCDACGVQIKGSKIGHCSGGRYGGCCGNFTLADFELHKVQVDSQDMNYHRRCLTDAEMFEKGWLIVNEKTKEWASPQRRAGAEKARAHFRGEG